MLAFKVITFKRECNMYMIKSFPLTYQEIMLVIGSSGTVFTIANILYPDDIQTSTIYTIIFLITFTAFITAYRIWNVAEKRFKFIKTREGYQLNKKILDAKLNIVVTHFSKNNPRKLYKKSLLEKMEKEVSVTRIVSNSPNRDDKWLNEFRGEKNYFEKSTELNFMPFDIYIIDNETVFLSFPSNVDQQYFTEGVLFKNEKLARLFEISLHKITNYRKENLENDTAVDVEKEEIITFFQKLPKDEQHEIIKKYSK